MAEMLGSYHLLARIGQGGMCDVLLAARGTQHIDFTKLVVIKKLRPEYAQDAEFVAMFLDEARIAARLNHPNVIQTIDCGQQDDDFYLAMEYLDGQPLNRISAHSPPMPLAMRLATLSDVLNGVHYAHELRDYDGTPLNVVHRDVTPHNVFVTYDGQVKVMDFGIAKAAGRASRTRGGVIKGKINYMAPEQVVTATPIDRRVDVFTVGIMLFEAAAGARMWHGVAPPAVLRTLITGAHPRSPRERNPDVPEELDRICRKALAPKPDDRYATAAAFREDLDEYIEKKEKRPSNRQIGAFVAEAFSQQRERARTLVETQISEVIGTRRQSIVSLHMEGEPSEKEAEIDITVSTETPAPRSPPASVEPTSATKLSPEAPVPAPDRSGRIYVLLTVAMVSFALLVFGAIRILRGGAGGGGLQQAGGGDTITLTLRATPLQTQFSIDDGPSIENPYIVKLPLDHKTHAVRASAPGFREEVERVVFDRDVSLRFALVHEAVQP